MTKAAFLDRDGVINQKAPDGQYVTRWEDFHLLPGAIEGVAQLNRAGFCVLIVTNQRCIAKGLLTEEELETLHLRMTRQLALGNAKIDGIYYCPHELEPPCPCRKPKPGMLLEAARARNLDLTASWMIGDSDCDIQAGKNAGCRTAWLSDRKFSATESLGEAATSINADVIASSLLEAVPKILRFGHS